MCHFRMKIPNCVMKAVFRLPQKSLKELLVGYTEEGEKKNFKNQALGVSDG